MTATTWLTPEDAAELIQRGKGRGVKVAVIDSGVEVSHPRLAGLELVDDIAVTSDGLQLNVVPGEGRDLYGHGTAVAGIIRSMAPEASIGSFRVLDGTLSAKSVGICEGVRQAIERGYHILNCSFGCGVAAHVMQYKQWVDEAYIKGVHVVAACNNDDFTRPEWPGYFTSVITVNMARTTEMEAFFYKRGFLVEFAASGVDIEVAWREKSVKKVSGSSFATPRVAGMLARLVSEFTELTPTQAKALFHRVAKPWTDEICGPNVLLPGVKQPIPMGGPPKWDF